MWIVAAIIAVVVIGLVIHLARKKRNLDTANQELFSFKSEEVFDFQFPQRDRYEEIKAKEGMKSKLTAQALMNRALADIPIILRMQREAPGIESAKRANFCPAEVWSGYQRASMMLSEEFESVKQEAEELQKGWGEKIFPSANAIYMQHMNQMMQAQQQKQEEEKKNQAHERAAKEAEEAGKRKEQQKESDAAQQQKRADQTFEQLMHEEEQAGRSKKGGQGSAKASKKHQ